ncbi:hypothetical protein BB561_003522 [Smittium simulii]|uniref:Uncharacterized protein n=1 Tax=Smittium simulii TaxID=133385 RepID=A0A2T9YKW8_9FUNG|nr:hypothetical protein BB561_003522 [Smittium simulii]
MKDFTELPSYKKLAGHYKKTAKNIDLCKEFSKDSDRQSTFCRKNSFENKSGNTAKIIFDFSKNHIDKITFSLLLDFAQEAQILDHIESFFSRTANKNIKFEDSYKDVDEIKKKKK